MKHIVLSLSLIFALLACKDEKSEMLDAQSIVDRSIAASGGENYKNSQISFVFRDRAYIRSVEDGKEVLKRIFQQGDSAIVDTRMGDVFNRYVNGAKVDLPDSLANSMANSINSVHYFVKLPYGLNDAAVNKKLLDTVRIHGNLYYEVEVTFKREGGGGDYEDVYVYWFNKETFKPDYLAYLFHTDDGGFRFREAFDERYVGGLRFVNYRNYTPKYEEVNVADLDSLFMAGELELLSVIELDSIRVNGDNYN